MATQPDPSPDTIDPQTAPEIPQEIHPVEESPQQPEEIVPPRPDTDNPGITPTEAPQAPD